MTSLRFFARCLAGCLLWAGASAQADGRLVEKLDRGVVALAMAKGVFVSWRLLGTEPDDVRFNVYRDGRRINAEPQALTNLVDAQGRSDSLYTVRAVVAGHEQPASAAASPWSQPYLRIPLQKPEGGTSPDGVAYTYEANDGAPADVDGDGQYELIVK